MKKIRPEFIAIFNCLLWGSAFVPGKYCLQTMHPIVLIVIRLTIALIFISLFLKENPFKIKKDKIIWVFLLSILKIAIVFTLFNIALSITDSSITAIVVGTSPSFSMVIATIFIKEESLNKNKLVAIIISLIAIVLLTLSKNNSSINIGANIIGIAILLLRNISTGIADVIVKKKLYDVPKSKLGFLQLFISIPILFIISLFIGSYSTINFNDIYLVGSIIWLALITSTTSLLWLYLISQKDVNISDISIWKLLIPTFGAILSWIILPNDKPSFLSIIALLLIVFSIFISNKGKSKQPL